MEEQELAAQLGSTSLSATALAIYTAAKECLGKHITLNELVPAELGCAEAVSYVLNKAGIPIPKKGFVGTAGLYDFLDNSSSFRQVANPTFGCIIISPSGTSKIQSPHGHTGIVGKYGILSNDSATGLFLEHWDLPRWQKYYGDALQFPILFYQPVN